VQQRKERAYGKRSAAWSVRGKRGTEKMNEGGTRKRSLRTQALVALLQINLARKFVLVSSS
jgi:hypothetical protein